MYDFFYNIGNAVINFFKPAAFVSSLPLLLEGMIGIFIVVGVIILSVSLLNKTGADKKKD